MRKVLYFLVFILACARPERPHPQGPGVTPAAQAKKVEQIPSTAKIDKNTSLLTPEQRLVVVAQIGDHTITLGELEARLLAEPPVLASQYASLQKRKDYLQKLVQFEVLAAEARRQGLDQDPDVIEQMKQAMVRRYLQTAAEADMKPESVTDADLHAFYDANPGLYHKPEQVEISHILLSDEAKAKKVLGELKAGSEGNPAKLAPLWNDYAVRLTEDKQTAPYLGSLGQVSLTMPQGYTAEEQARQQAVPAPVVQAAMLMQPYELGPLVHSDKGWHILMATSRSPAVERSFDEVKDSIRVRIVKRERELRRQKVLDDLRAQAKVEIHEDALRLIRIEPPAVNAKGMPIAPTPSSSESEDLAPPGHLP